MDSGDYIHRLHSWNKLRASLEGKDAQNICKQVNDYWIKCKNQKYYLHPVDIQDWPTPWELINDNIYCSYATGLAIIYTLLLLGIKDIDFVDIVYDNNENIPIVLVDNAKYMLNGFQDELLNIISSDYKIVKRYDIKPLKKKAGIDD
jgi:hypothetical protein